MATKSQGKSTSLMVITNPEPFNTFLMTPGLWDRKNSSRNESQEIAKNSIPIKHDV